ncbi:MAG: hypothetical protein BWY93_01475 [Euryarchaeota archaeon ADurb.BinA087]|nr:MAG: hypothetical protein BWY93_01475 [Euryarchaeota archaeon ADurb.BinA087]
MFAELVCLVGGIIIGWLWLYRGKKERERASGGKP